MTAARAALRSLRSLRAARGHRDGHLEVVNTPRGPLPKVCSSQLPKMCSFQLPLTAIRFGADLSIPALQKALKALIRRHEILRTTIELDRGCG